LSSVVKAQQVDLRGMRARSRRFRSDDAAKLFVEFTDERIQQIPREHLRDERPTFSQDLPTQVGGFLNQRDTAGVIGRVGPADSRGHVREHHLERPSLESFGQARVAHLSRDVLDPGNRFDVARIHRDHFARVPQEPSSEQRPASGGGAEIEHPIALVKDRKLLSERFELEGRSRPKPLTLGRPIVRVFASLRNKSSAHDRSWPFDAKAATVGSPEHRGTFRTQSQRQAGKEGERAKDRPALGSGGKVGPSEFESESLAPQARRMVQATPRPQNVSAA